MKQNKFYIKNLMQLAIIITLQCYISKAQAQENNEIQYTILEGNQMNLNQNKNSFIIPLQLSQQGSSLEQNNNFNFGLILIELFIDSPIQYKVSLMSRDQSKFDRIFNNLNGYHHLKYNAQSDLLFIQLQIINENENENDISNLEYNRQLTLNLFKSKQYTFRIFSQQQTRCPFNCHGNGVCELDQCKCNEGYLESHNCQIKIDHFVVEFDKKKLIQNQLSDIPDQWYYASLEIQQIEQIKYKILNRSLKNEQPFDIIISFLCDKDIDVNNKLAILNNHNYFKSLISQTLIKDNQQMISYTIKLDIKRLLYDQQYIKKPIIFRWKNEVQNLNVLAQIVNIDQQIVYESFELVFWGCVSILLFSFLSTFLIKKQNISIFEINAQIQKEFKELTEKELKDLIKQQISIFNYQSQQQDLENGSHKECYICLSEYQTSDELSKTQCGHVFHKSCLNVWLKKNTVCPLDRKQLLEIK